MSGLDRIPAFTDRGDPGEHFFVQHAHVSPRFLIAVTDLLPDRSKFTTHFHAQLQNLRFHRFDAFRQGGQLAHLSSRISTRSVSVGFKTCSATPATATAVPEWPTTVASSAETVQIDPRL